MLFIKFSKIQNQINLFFKIMNVFNLIFALNEQFQKDI
jgi:hypothetical protein